MIRLLRFKYSFSHKSWSHVIQKNSCFLPLMTGSFQAVTVLLNGIRPPPQGPRERGRQLTSLSCLKAATDLWLRARLPLPRLSSLWPCSSLGPPYFAAPKMQALCTGSAQCSFSVPGNAVCHNTVKTVGCLWVSEMGSYAGVIKPSPEHLQFQLAEIISPEGVMMWGIKKKTDSLIWGICLGVCKSPIIICRQPCLEAVLGVGVRTWSVGGSERRKFLQRCTGNGDFLKRAVLETPIPAPTDRIQSHPGIIAVVDQLDVFLIGMRQDCSTTCPEL